ncbi:hypothetical protein BRC97_10480 [Halobacteriales archaeon QS_6_71_20]|nr:MAG: hypothetical protein BRC97_10480 [Halobacteriales archaeon QS_6_71_20]
MSGSADPDDGPDAAGRAAPEEPPAEPYLAAAAADRWDVLRYEDGPGPVHRVVPAGAGSEIVTTYTRRTRSRRRILLASVPVAAVGLPAAGWLLAGVPGIVAGALLAAVTAAVIVRRHVAAPAPGDGDAVPAVVDASVPAGTARSYGLENAEVVDEAEAYLDATPGAAPDRSPEAALEAAEER